MKKAVVALSALAALVFSLTAAAETPDRPRGSYIVVDPALVDVDREPQAAGGPGLIIYMNRDGGNYSCGQDNSRTNRSSLACGRTISLPPYPYGDASWNQVMSCFRNMYSRYNVVVTDVDPGNTPHVESVVAGRASDAGFQQGVGGVAPFTCGLINNAIVYTFPQAVGNNPRVICEIAAQETAHAFGLDHEYLCLDPMTYRTGCGAKSFQDRDASCGTSGPESCMCGGATQNSHRRLLALFGANGSTPPNVTITSPSDGTTVQAGFSVEASVVSSTNIQQVQLFVDNNAITQATSAPYVFPTPPELAEGSHTIMVRATNQAGLTGDASITINIGPPCVVNGDCGAGLNVCLDGQCVPGPGETGGLGEICVDAAECFSGVCAQSGDSSLCTSYCPSSGICPGGFTCVGTAGAGVCWPGDGDGGGCCAVAGSRRGTRHIPWLAFGLSLFAFVAVRRRFR